jgi:hypothetical protein
LALGVWRLPFPGDVGVLGDRGVSRRDGRKQSFAFGARRLAFSVPGDVGVLGDHGVFLESVSYWLLAIREALYCLLFTAYCLPFTPSKNSV